MEGEARRTSQGDPRIGAASTQGLEKPIQPSILHLGLTGGGPVHEVLGFEVGPRGVGASAGVHDAQVPGCVQRLQGLQVWVEAEEPIEIDFIACRNLDIRSLGVVVSVSVGHHEGKAIRCASQA